MCVRYARRPLGYGMYAIGILPLIRKLQPSQAKQFWYADDANGGGTLNNIRRWWDQLNSEGARLWLLPECQQDMVARQALCARSGEGAVW